MKRFLLLRSSRLAKVVVGLATIIGTVVAVLSYYRSEPQMNVGPVAQAQGQSQSSATTKEPERPNVKNNATNSPTIVNSPINQSSTGPCSANVVGPANVQTKC